MLDRVDALYGMSLISGSGSQAQDWARSTSSSSQSSCFSPADENLFLVTEKKPSIDVFRKSREFSGPAVVVAPFSGQTRKADHFTFAAAFGQFR